MKQQTSKQKITKDMPISDILVQNSEKAPEIAEVMMDFGIHCIGCGAAAFETLEQGVLGHGFSEEDLSNLLLQLNKIIETKRDSKKKGAEGFSLRLTTNAIDKIKEIMKKSNKKNSFLRISVVGGGCSGFMYNLEITDNHNPLDVHFEQAALNILVDKNSLEFLNGAEIDFVDTLNESGFKFNNPNAKKSCGCGKSFR